MSENKLTRRRFLQIALGTTAATVLAACAPKPAPAPEPTAKPAEEPTKAPEATKVPEATVAQPAEGEKVNITWLVLPEEPRRPWYKYCTETVPQQNPGTTLELVEVSWGEYETKLNAMLAAGTPIDLWCQWGTNNFVDYTFKGMVLPIDDMVSAMGVDLSDYFPRWLEENKIKGRLCGLPVYAGGAYVFYNAKLFDEAGVPHPPTKWNTDDWTLNAMLESARKLTKNWGDFEKGQYGVASTNGLPFEDEIWLFGGEAWPKEAYRDIAKEIRLDQPECIEALQWWADLSCVHKVAPDAEAAGALSQAGIGGLAGGRCAMDINGVWSFNSAVSVKDFQWGVAALPKGKALKNGIYADPIMVARTTKHKEAAFKTMLVITGDEALKTLCGNSLWPSPRKSHLDYWASQVIAKGSATDAAGAKECILGSWEYGQYAPMNDIAGYSQKTWDVVVSGLNPLWQCQKKAAELLPEITKAENTALAELQFPGVPW